MLNVFISGGDYKYNDSRGEQVIKFEGLVKYKDKTFVESLGEYTDDNLDDDKNSKKRVIIYTLQN